MSEAHEQDKRFRTAFWRAMRSQVSLRLAVLCLILWVTVTWFLWANSASPLHRSLVNLSANLHVDVSSTGSAAIQGNVLDGSDESPTRAKGVHRWPVRLEVERQGRGGVVLAEQMRVVFRSGESSQPTVDMKRDLEVARALASDPRLAPWRNDLLNGRLAASREYPMRAMLLVARAAALPAVVIFVPVFTVLYWRAARTAKRVIQTCCLRCGYSLPHQGSLCPECGTKDDSTW